MKQILKTMSVVLLTLTLCGFGAYAAYTKEQEDKEEPRKPIVITIVNDTYSKDSLCKVWVDSTHLRVAFKSWYNLQTKNKK